MKKVLITGKNSYVGNNLERWLNQYPEKYTVDKISLRDESWKAHDFSIYDVVVHCAGIAHQKETKQNAELYYKVNRDLTVELAKKAKTDNVKQFIFLSSMSVYGLDEGIIDKNTLLEPKTNYGKSKLQAEQLILPFTSMDFKIAIIRPPMIYGKGCKGNYQRLAKLALKTPIFPNISNTRSMIYIDNLSEFIRIIIEDEKEGLFFPQNDEYVCTSELVSLIAKANGQNILMIKLFNPLIKLLMFSTVQKVFGNLAYSEHLKDKEVSKSLCFIDFDRSIKLTEE